MERPSQEGGRAVDQHIGLRFYGEHKTFAGFTALYEESTDEHTDSVEMTLPLLKEGQQVRIINGPMKGLTGRLEKIRDKRHLIVYIEVVGQYIPVHIPRAKVEPV